jgi:hypothetical protein
MGITGVNFANTFKKHVDNYIIPYLFKGLTKEQLVDKRLTVLVEP